MTRPEQALAPSIVDRLVWPATAVAVVPIVLAAARAATSGWLPLGDNAYFTVRSRDVLGPYHPLLGAWSSGSVATGRSVNNLGPLQLDLLAPFTKIAPAAGTAIGSATINVAAVVAIAVVVHRVASSTIVLIAMAAASLLAWTMGSALLIEPRQHHALLLPFLCFSFLCWATATGDRWVLAPTAFVASLIIQTHLTYLILVPSLSAAAVIGLVWSTHGAGATGDGERWWRPLRGPGLITAAVLVISWIQPALDQVSGTGNLGRVIGSSSGEGAAPGFASGIGIATRILTRPTAWGRSGFRDFRPGSNVSAWAGALGLIVLLLLLIGLALLTVRRGDRRAAVLDLMAALAVVSAVVSASLFPSGVFGPAEGNYRWLWPISVFVATALAASVVSLMTVPSMRSASGSTAAPGSPVRPQGPEVIVGVFALVSIAVLTVANVPTSYQIDILRREVAQRAAVRDLLGQLDDADLTGPVLVDRSQEGFASPYGYPILVELQKGGVAFTFGDTPDVDRFGDGRADRGRAAMRLSLAAGGAALEPHPGSTRIAFTSPATRRSGPEDDAAPFGTAALFLEPIP